ncbi:MULTISPECIES: hypothetical protein [Pseudomonas]|uniref:Uncharacterized protein n=1 Tax=Pseudomonas sessilinigenes TaxID=658629 RepID=A0ABX8MUQ0_9PSED|nr:MULTISPECIES: hypothetical protein [Pseudomonas]AZC23950.1 hypothetical protein C4K39_2276 [Pseudomonas sessilinigenes]QIH08857.1 hypothetical protein ATY02_20030 [Pseudomonas sp. BIOMIG1BAC]QXH42921.1 hypothetical protein KSS89_12110 [Pseudomonas sessilinigenes]
MASEAFIHDFARELANRAFALITVRRLCERLEGDKSQVFWKTYWDLELFNADRYGAAARHWGLDATPAAMTRLKAWLISSTPKVLLGALVRVFHKGTIDYVDWLRKLRQAGPVEARAFLDYMVEQEVLQVEMMQLAIAGRYSDIAQRADAFFLKYNGVTLGAQAPSESQGAGA